MNKYGQIKFMLMSELYSAKILNKQLNVLLILMIK